MKKKFTEEQIQHLEKIGRWFKRLPGKAKIDMKQAINKNKEKHLCGTPACVGGWLNIYYKNGEDDYVEGARQLAMKKLGFINMTQLCEFFQDNPKIWGNDKGRFLFSRPYAYNEGKKEYYSENITTNAIGKKFLAVAGRIRESQK